MLAMLTYAFPVRSVDILVAAFFTTIKPGSCVRQSFRNRGNHRSLTPEWRTNVVRICSTWYDLGNRRFELIWWFGNAMSKFYLPAVLSGVIIYVGDACLLG